MLNQLLNSNRTSNLCLPINSLNSIINLRQINNWRIDKIVKNDIWAFFDKMPKIYANVINLSRPKKMNIKIYTEFGCGKSVQELDIEFNDANYSIVLDFNTSSTDIFATIISQFDDYQYNVQRYTIDDDNFTLCIYGDDLVDICYKTLGCSNTINETISDYYVKVPKKNKTKSFVLPN